jgi:HrpA-like RNA helicase
VLTRTLEDVVLHMKAVGVPHLQRFPFPTPPDSATLRAAQLLLRNLGALGREFSRSSPAPGSGDSVADGPITSMGRAMSLLPLSARHARMLILAKQAGVMEHGIAMVAILAESEPFLGRKGNLWRHPVSDALGRLQAVGAYAHAVGRGQCSKEFCEEHQLHAPSMERVMQLRSQLTRLANLRFGNETGWVKLNPRGDLAPPTPAQSDLLRQAVLGGLLDHVARRVYGVGKSPTRAYYSACTGSYSSALVVSSRSGLHTENPADMPAWLVFADVKEVGKRGDLAMQCCTAIDPEWLAVLAADSPLLRLSGPVEQPAPQYDTVRDMVMTHVSPRYGDQSWDLPLHRVPLREVAGQEAQYRWVARLLLEGRIDPSFAPLGAAGVLSDSPAVLTRGFTLDPPPPLMLQKASQIVNDLASKNVWSMESLRREWSCNPNFLRSTILLWVRKEGAKKEIFRKAWSEAQKKVARQT